METFQSDSISTPIQDAVPMRIQGGSIYKNCTEAFQHFILKIIF